MRKLRNGTNGSANGHDPETVSTILFLQSPKGLHLFSHNPEEQALISHAFDRITQSVRDRCLACGIVIDTSKAETGEILVSGKTQEIEKLKGFMRRRSWLLCSRRQRAPVGNHAEQD